MLDQLQVAAHDSEDERIDAAGQVLGQSEGRAVADDAGVAQTEGVVEQTQPHRRRQDAVVGAQLPDQPAPVLGVVVDAVEAAAVGVDDVPVADVVGRRRVRRLDAGPARRQPHARRMRSFGRRQPHLHPPQRRRWSTVRRRPVARCLPRSAHISERFLRKFVSHYRLILRAAFT